MIIWEVIEVSKKFKFIQLPIDIIMNETLPPLAKILYGEIAVLSHKNGYCFATNKYLGQINKVDSRTIARLLKILKQENYIKIVFHKNKPNSTKRQIFIIEV